LNEASSIIRCEKLASIDTTQIVWQLKKLFFDVYGILQGPLLGNVVAHQCQNENIPVEGIIKKPTNSLPKAN